MKCLFKNLIFSLLTIIFVSCAAKDIGLTGGEGINPDPDFLRQEPYPENRNALFEHDLKIMDTKERTAGQTYHSVVARSAVRRVFADISLRFKGTRTDFLNMMLASASESKPDRLIYRIEAPAYIDEYAALFNAENVFTGVEYKRNHRLRKDAGF